MAFPSPSPICYLCNFWDDSALEKHVKWDSQTSQDRGTSVLEGFAPSSTSTPGNFSCAWLRHRWETQGGPGWNIPPAPIHLPPVHPWAKQDCKHCTPGSAHSLTGCQQPKKNIMLMCLHTGYKEYISLEVRKVFFSFFKDSRSDPQHIFKGEDFYADVVCLKRFQPLRYGGTKEKSLPSVSIKVAQLLLKRIVAKDCFS